MAALPNQQPQTFGRVRLTQVVEAWAAEQPLNPRLLAKELADVLRTIGPAKHVLNHAAASVTLYDPTTGAGGVTIEALANYFDRYSVGAPADTIETTNGAAQAGAVLIARNWIGRLEIEAEARATIAAGLQQVAPAPIATGGAQPTEQHQPPLSGSDPECIALRQAQQRQEGEQSAKEQLEAARLAQQRAEKNTEKALAKAEVAIQQLAALQQELARLREALNTSTRQLLEAKNDACDLEEELEQLAIFAECLRTDNPLSPPELRMAFQCWCDLTQNGQHNPAGKGGRGVHGQVAEWAQEQGLDLNRDQLARLQAVVSWRKRGAGAIASY